MAHKHLDSETNGIGLAGRYPFFTFFEQLGTMFVKNPRRHKVAGRPVVNIGQKLVETAHRFVIILYGFDNEPVKIVLIIIDVGKQTDKLHRFGKLRKFLGELSQLGRANADNGIGANRRHKLALKVLVFKVLKQKKL